MLDVMHGGAAGVIFDMSTTTALCPLAQPGFVCSILENNQSNADHLFRGKVGVHGRSHPLAKHILSQGRPHWHQSPAKQ